MPTNLTDTLVVGISSRALFDLEKENEIFEKEGLLAYQQFQIKNEARILNTGTAFHLIRSLLKLNSPKKDKKLIEVVVLSRNSPDTALRILNSIKHYELPITRSAFTSSVSLAHYIDAFDVDLFLSKSEVDIQAVIDTGSCAAALIYTPPKDYTPDISTLRIAFDADAVIFSEESELIYKQHGIDEFRRNETMYEDVPLKEGPFGKFFKLLAKIQRGLDDKVMRIAIVTARDYPSNIRVIKTLRHWGVAVDEAFFLGGLSKEKILKAFNAHIFFDDQHTYVKEAAVLVPSSRVPYKQDSLLNQYTTKAK